MPRRRGLNPSWREKAAPPALHPVLSAACFSSLADRTGGATMNVRTRDVAIPHSSGYIVGGQPDRTGARVPTKYEPTSSIDRVLQNRESIARGTDDPHAAMGYWRDKTVKDSPFEVDSSTNVVDRSAAKTIGKHRGEKAVWDLGKMEDIRLDGKHD